MRFIHLSSESSLKHPAGKSSKVKDVTVAYEFSDYNILLGFSFLRLSPTLVRKMVPVFDSSGHPCKVDDKILMQKSGGLVTVYDKPDRKLGNKIARENLLANPIVVSPPINPVGIWESLQALNPDKTLDQIEDIQFSFVNRAIYSAVYDWVDIDTVVGDLNMNRALASYFPGRYQTDATTKEVADYRKNCSLLGIIIGRNLLDSLG